jgi:hypothetical protein
VALPPHQIADLSPPSADHQRKALACELCEPDAFAIRTTGRGTPRARTRKRSVLMMRKLLATSCLAGTIIIAAAALATAAPNPAESGPSMSNSTTPTTSTTSPNYAPTNPGHSGYGY